MNARRKQPANRGLRLEGHSLMNRTGSTSELAVCKCGAQSVGKMHTTARRRWSRRHIEAILFRADNRGSMAAAIVASAGISYRQLDYWTRRGYLVGPGKGSGLHRDWDDDAPFVAAEMARLIKVGITVDTAHALAMRHINEPSPDGHYRLAEGLSLRIESN